MKEPLYPVEITTEVLKELKDEKMYHIIYSDGGGESWSGAWIKGHVDVNCISIIYLPLSSTPLKQLSDEEIKCMNCNCEIPSHELSFCYKCFDDKPFWEPTLALQFILDNDDGVHIILNEEARNTAERALRIHKKQTEEKEPVYDLSQSDHINPIELLESILEQGKSVHPEYLYEIIEERISILKHGI